MADTHLAILLDRLVRRMHISLHKKAPQFDTERVGPSGAMLLLTLDEMGSGPLHALTARLARDKSQMTRLVQSLERKGLILRTPSTQDNRVTLVSLTPAGRDVVETHQAAIAETIEGSLTALSDAEKQQFQALLAKAVLTHSDAGTR